MKGIVVSPPVMNRFGYKKKKPIAISNDAREHDVFNVSFLTTLSQKRKESHFIRRNRAVYGKWDAKRKAANRMKKILGSTPSNG